MYMTQSEIADRYVRRGTSITILAELNATRVDQIREILTDAGVELPEAKKNKAAAYRVLLRRAGRYRAAHKGTRTGTQGKRP